MPDFVILDHTADTGFRAWGETVEDLFIHAAEALVSVALDPSGAEAWAPRQLSASGADLQELLVNFLNEVLYFLDAELLVPARFETLWFEPQLSDSPAGSVPRTVITHLLVDRRDDARHPPRIVVKAVTFHQLRIGEHNGRWEAEVYLDI